MNSYQESLAVGGIRIVANLLMIGALFLAMYMASASYGSGLATFLLWFFGITIPVWVVALYVTKRIRRFGQSRFCSYIVLPGESKPCLVQWTVLERCGKVEK